MRYYAKSTGGFYDSAVHTTMPADAVAISDEAYAALLAGQAAGKLIAADASGHPVLADPPPPDPVVTAENAIDAMLDAKAVEWGYKDGDRLARYANSTNAKWKAEAQAFLSWADACWQKALDIQTQAEASGVIPTVAEVLAQMPAVTRPS